MDFIDLHLHSNYSFLDGYGTIPQIISRAKELDRKAIAITEHGNISSHVKLEQEAKSNNIKPIFGCELYLIPNIENNTREKSHVTVLAKNQTGYQSLLNLVTLGWANFYYKPTVDLAMLVEHQDGLIVLSGCYSGILRKLILDESVKLVKFVDFLVGRIDNFYLELQPFEIMKEVNSTLYDIGQRKGIPCCVTSDIHFPEKKHHYAQKMFYCINQRKTWSEVNYNMPENMYQREGNVIYNECLALHPSIEWDGIFDNTLGIGQQCDVELPKATKMIEVPQDIAFKDLCFQGLAKRGKDKDELYNKRMSYEIGMIEKKDFVNYFLIVADFINWAKKHNILFSPARGSSAGSLVCYILGITEVDPIFHNLSFERFLDESRSDYPDIDIDCSEIGRDLVLEYLKEKYGEANVGQLATFAEFRGKNSMDEVGKIFEVPKQVVETVKAQLLYSQFPNGEIIKNSIRYSKGVGDIVARYKSLKTAMLLEGQLRHMGSHAGGFVISDEIKKCCAMYRNGLLSCDKEDSSYLNFVKIDILVLNALGNVKRILGQAEMPIDDIYNLPLDDGKVLKAFDEGDTLGVFQFGGRATASILSSITVNKFDQLVAINALSRPGPSKMVDEYAHRTKTGAYPQTSKEYDDITRNTYGLPIYQEQVMELVRRIGNFSWGDTHKARKAISNKSVGDESFDKYREQFLRGAIDNGHSAEIANQIWDYISEFGAYAFNKSHAVAYSILAYWMMYFKVYHPLLFYWASITEEKDDKLRSQLLSEVELKGYRILPPDVNKSDLEWAVDEQGLRTGLNHIKGIGNVIAGEIMGNRPYESVEDLKEKCAKRTVNSRVLRILEENKAFSGIIERKTGMEKDICEVSCKRQLPNECSVETELDNKEERVFSSYYEED